MKKAYIYLVEPPDGAMYVIFSSQGLGMLGSKRRGKVTRVQVGKRPIGRMEYATRLRAVAHTQENKEIQERVNAKILWWPSIWPKEARELLIEDTKAVREIIAAYL